MLTTGIALAVIMAAFEIFVVTRLRPEYFTDQEWRWAKPLYRLGPWVEKSALRSLVFSLALSFAIGVLFAPGANIAVLIGGVLSTVIVQPYYSARRISPKVRGHVVDAKATVKRAATASGTRSLKAGVKVRAWTVREKNRVLRKQG
jgi:hypothetical protein